MSPTASLPAALAHLLAQAWRWLLGWWRLAHLGALLLALALSPSSYRAEPRRTLARHLVQATAPALPGFLVLSTLISLVVIRIVTVTALSYGLSQYALEMVVRVLVLELIPLAAALFAALRSTIPLAMEVAQLRERRRWQLPIERSMTLLRGELLPRVSAGVFGALMLGAVSGLVTLVVAYLSIYGPTVAGFTAYTRTVGHVFSPAVSLIFALKLLLFGFTVALVPMAAVLEPHWQGRTSAELHGLVRMFLVILLIEVASLVGNYY